MFFFASISFLIAMFSIPLITALPVSPDSPISLPRSVLRRDALSQILAIATTSNTCSGAPVPSECATASQAAEPLISAFAKYSISNPWEITSVLSLMAFETQDFKYNINHYPGRAGQGTRNMQMGSFNIAYANSFPELQAGVQSITGGAGASSLSDQQLNDVRALVLTDQYTWGSGAWFLSTQCSNAVRGQIQAGGQAGFTAYMGCVGTGVTSDRLAYFTKAMTAFGLS